MCWDAVGSSTPLCRTARCIVEWLERGGSHSWGEWGGGKYGGGLSYRAEHCGTTRASAYFTPPLAMETERERANTDRRERGSLTVYTTHSQVIGACASPECWRVGGG